MTVALVSSRTGDYVECSRTNRKVNSLKGFLMFSIRLDCNFYKVSGHFLTALGTALG